MLSILEIQGRLLLCYSGTNFQIPLFAPNHHIIFSIDKYVINFLSFIYTFLNDLTNTLYISLPWYNITLHFPLQCVHCHYSYLRDHNSTTDFLRLIWQTMPPVVLYSLLLPFSLYNRTIMAFFQSWSTDAVFMLILKQLEQQLIHKEIQH